MAVTDIGKVAYLQKGAYSSETNYEINDVVTYEGSSYVSKINNNIGNLPTNTTYWDVVAEKGADGQPGQDGKDGKDGKDGVDGYTPVKGVDYFTSTEIQGIESDIKSGLSTVATTGSYDDLTNKPTIPDVSTLQPKIDSTHKLDSDLVDDTNQTNKFVTATDKTNWNGKQDTIQYTTMPTASVDNLGKIAQYIGTTTSSYTNGYYYQVVSDGEETPTYSWANISVQKQVDSFPTYKMQDTSYIDFSQYANYIMNSASKTDLCGIIKQMIANNEKYSIVFGGSKGNAATTTKGFFQVKVTMSSTTEGAISITPIMNGYEAQTKLKYNGGSSIVSYTNTVAVNETTGDVTLGTYPSASGDYGYLSITNGHNYTVSGDYVPTHKKYVDEKVAKYETVASFPSASSTNAGKVMQYIGTTTTNYTKGHFYECKESGGVYSWVEIEFGGGGGSVDLSSTLGTADLLVKYNTVRATDYGTGYIELGLNTGDTDVKNTLLAALLSGINNQISKGIKTCRYLLRNDATGNNVTYGYSYLTVQLPSTLTDGTTSMFIRYDLDTNQYFTTNYNTTPKTTNRIQYEKGRNYNVTIANGVATAVAIDTSISTSKDYMNTLGFNLKNLTGFDATKTQTLKNVQGVYTWVDD